MNLDSKNIVVTGGASGIGKAMASRFIAEGAAQVVIADINGCLLYTSPSPRDVEESRMPSSA